MSIGNRTTAGIKLLYTNVRGINAKFDEITKLLVKKNPDALVLTETKANQGIFNDPTLDSSVYGVRWPGTEYTMFSTKPNRSGGVSILVHDRHSPARGRACHVRAHDNKALMIRAECDGYRYFLVGIYNHANSKEGYQAMKDYVNVIR